MNAALSKSIQRMSATEYLAWSDAQTERYDFFEGEVFAMSGGTAIHNAISGNVFAALKSALAQTPCRVYINDVRLEIKREAHYTYPDVFVTCEERDKGEAAQLTKRFPALICEVLSPTTAGYDLGRKFAHYQQSETLRDVLFIDPEVRTIQHFQKNAAERWEIVPSEPNGAHVLAAFDFQLDAQVVFEGIDDL